MIKIKKMNRKKEFTDEERILEKVLKDEVPSLKNTKKITFIESNMSSDISIIFFFTNILM